MITDKEFELANQRSEKRHKGPIAIAARYDRRNGRVVISLSTGFEIAFPPKSAESLQSATPAQLDITEISPSGLGIHFPKIDADLYLPTLLEGTMGSKSWMAARMGSTGGSVKSEAKAASSRSNGVLGGRPRKKTVIATKVAQ